MQTRVWDRQGKGARTFTEPGFGTAQIGGLYRPANANAAAATIPPALWADLKAQGLLRPDAATGAP